MAPAENTDVLVESEAMDVVGSEAEPDEENSPVELVEKIELDDLSVTMAGGGAEGAGATGSAGADIGAEGAEAAGPGIGGRTVGSGLSKRERSNFCRWNSTRCWAEAAERPKAASKDMDKRTLRMLMSGSCSRFTTNFGVS